MSGSVDLELARWIADHRSSPLTRVCQALEHVGESPALFVVPVVATLAAFVALNLWSELPRLAVAMVVTVAVTGTMKERLGRPRPPADLALTTLHGPAMPSSHAVLTSSILVVVLMLWPWTSRRARLVVAIAGTAGCLLIGAAMIYLGGHWLSDVLVGWALGAVLTGGTMLLWTRIGLPGGRRRVVA